VTPEATGYLDKARQCLAYARVNLGVDLGNDAGRNAHLATFHSAQAFIFDRIGKAAKTHNGVPTEFNRLAKNEPRIGQEFRRFLTQAYNMKAVADYEMGADAVIPTEHAAIAIATAERFVACIAALLTEEAP
jgi:uncharacterized protein (UPF0332 family)